MLYCCERKKKLESKNVAQEENLRIPRWPVDSVPMIRRLFPEILDEKPKEQSMKDKRYFIEDSDLSYDFYRCSVCDWEAKIPCPDHSMKKDKRYFIEIVIKDSDTLEPVRSVSTSSDYSESLFSPPVDHRIANEVNGCLGILFSMPLNKNKK